MNNTNQPTTKTNPGFIGIDVLPRLKRREGRQQKRRQARCLYILKVVFMAMVVIFAAITAIGVIGSIQMASLGLHSLAVTFLLIGIGSSVLMLGSLYKVREIAERSYALNGEL